MAEQYRAATVTKPILEDLRDICSIVGHPGAKTRALVKVAESTLNQADMSLIEEDFRLARHQLLYAAAYIVAAIEKLDREAQS